MDLKLELVIMPVADVDRAKAFYTEKAGFALDVDHSAGDNFRVVQMTPPGSACSITVGKGLTEMAPGSVQGLHLVVTDIVAACKELSARGVEIGEIHHFTETGRQSGPHPDRSDYNSFSSFSDPDGNVWVLQERRG